MQIDIKCRWDGRVLFTAELSAEFETASTSVRLGAAVKLALGSGADLCGADLRGADLYGADLRGADLCGADLRGADLCEGVKLVGERPLLAIGPIGSRQDTLLAFITNIGVLVRTGCFQDKPLEEFRAAVESEHGDNEHGREYRAAIPLIQMHADLWTPPAEETEAEAA